MVPFTPIGTPSNIKIGNVDTGLQGDKLSTSYFEIDCGVKYVEEFFKTFADYAPYTKIHIFIPYCGIFELNPDDVLSSSGGGVKVVYHIDVFSGSCVAFVQCNSGGKWHVLQQHAGNISAQFPITGANFASVYIGAINAIGSVAGGIASGGMGVLSGGISGASQISNIKPEYQRSGGVTSVSGIMGIQYPYLIYSTPQYIVADNFRDVKGHVSNLKCTVSSCTGFLQATADNSELSGIGCTAYELDLIRGLLAEGIYV
jgi:PPE-repeat protein